MDEGEHLLGTFINTIHDRQVGINVDSATYVEGGSSFIRFSTPQMALRTLLLLFDDADLSLFSNPRKGNRLIKPFNIAPSIPLTTPPISPISNLKLGTTA